MCTVKTPLLWWGQVCSCLVAVAEKDAGLYKVDLRNGIGQKGTSILQVLAQYEGMEFCSCNNHISLNNFILNLGRY